MSRSKARLVARAAFAGLACVGLAAQPGCASSAVAEDARYVQRLTEVERLPDLTGDVDPLPPENTERLLAEPLDAERAVRLALLGNRQLRAQLREIGVARGELLQAGILPNPRAEAELLPERNTRVELRLEYDITRAVLAPLAARARAPEVEAARYRAAAFVVSLGQRVRDAVYRLQAAEQRLAITELGLEALAARHEVAQAQRAAGNVPALEVASEEAAYERARIDAAKRALDVASERENLQRLLGLHGAATEWRVQPELPPVPPAAQLPPDLERRAISASLPLREMRSRLEALARRAGWTRAAGALPDIAVDVHGLHGDPDDVPGSDEAGWRFGAGISVELPLFDRRQGTAASLEAEFDALLESYHGVAIEVRSAAREAQNRVLSAHVRARQYEDVILPAQRRVTEQTLLQYNAMQLGVFQLLEARRAELEAEMEMVDTRREYWSAVAVLEALLAGQHTTASPPEPGGSTPRQAERGEEH